MNVIRVFPRRTSMTPIDSYAFVGDPPLFRPSIEAVDEVHVSVTFTWDIEEAQRLREAWAQYYPVVKIGGPAIDEKPPGEFVPGFYLKQGVVITSRGCPFNCPWCLVPGREGKIRELTVKSGWLVQDNNLLATSRKHQERVFAMLRTQKRAISFTGGLDKRLLTDRVAEQLRNLKLGQVFLSADTAGGLEALRGARRKLCWLPRRKVRCYTLIAFEGESTPQAEERLQAVWDAGCLPFAQLYQPPDSYIRYSPEWRALARTWSRPAAMFAVQKQRMAAIG